jgi:hypothetical protein
MATPPDILKTRSLLGRNLGDYETRLLTEDEELQPLDQDFMDARGSSGFPDGPDWADLKRSEDAPPPARVREETTPKGGTRKTAPAKEVGADKKGPRDIEKDWPERTKRDREDWTDEDLLAAYALMERNQFRNAMGRAGNQVSAALAGVKNDDSFYDEQDQHADAPVKKVQALRESARARRKDLREEAKDAATEEDNDLNSASTRAAQAVLLEVEPGMKGLAERMTAADIKRYFPMLKDSIKARHQRTLEDIRQKGQTERNNADNAAAARASGAKNEAQNRYAAAMEKFANIKEREFEFKEGQVRSDRWEPKDPTIVPRPTDLSNFAKLDHRTMSILDFLDVIDAAFKDGGGRIMPGYEKELMESFRTAVMQDQQKVLENGVLSAADMEVLEQLFKSPNSLKSLVFDDTFKASMAGMKSRAKNNLIRRADALGLRLREKPIGSGAQNTQADPRPGAAPSAAPAPGEQKAYSPSTNKTYILVNGKAVREEEGDTRGR